jgi:hypothetical protein
MGSAGLKCPLLPVENAAFAALGVGRECVSADSHNHSPRDSHDHLPTPRDFWISSPGNAISRSGNGSRFRMTKTDYLARFMTRGKIRVRLSSIPFYPMLALVESLTAICAITMTCVYAGRIAAMMLTAIAAATGALILSPFLDWAVESPTDVLALVFQTIVGLAVAYAWPRERRCSTSRPIELRTRLAERRHSMLEIVRVGMGRDVDLADRSGDVHIYGELDGAVTIPGDKLAEILSDVLRMAFADGQVGRVSIFTGRQPSRNQISVVAEYNLGSALPRFRLLGRSDTQHSIRENNWPPYCSATRIDNGFEYIFLISICKDEEL